MKKILIHYPFIAKYRMPIFSLLNQSKKFKYEFWADESNNDKYLLTENKGLNFKQTSFHQIDIPILKKSLEWQPTAIKNILSSSVDVYIVLGNPNSLSTWICVLVANLRQIPVAMWSHGYLSDEGGIKGFIRKLFYKLSDYHLLYGNKAKGIMINKGFKEEKIHVIYNSLDYEKQKYYREKLDYNNRLQTRKKYGFYENSIVLLVVGRLMKKLKIDQLLTALSKSNKDVKLFIIGDGPAKEDLELLSTRLRVRDKVVFYGACHDEEQLSRLFNASDYSVVMGKVGLSAMHSLAYGIPMITNNNIDEHFPEIEAVIEGETGFYFAENNIDDFESKLRSLPYRGEIYKNCITIIEKCYTPEVQFKLIENAIIKILER